MKKDEDYCFRLISNQVRFGYGYRLFEGRRQYFAWHGYPDRNDDYITNVEISEEEFELVDIIDDDEFEKAVAEFDKITAEE